MFKVGGKYILLKPSTSILIFPIFKLLIDDLNNNPEYFINVSPIIEYILTTYGNYKNLNAAENSSKHS